MESSAASESQAFEVPGEERPAGSRDELRERIEAVVSELERLRAENAALAARVATMEGADSGTLPLEFTPTNGEDMRARLDGFIAAIDQAIRDAAAETPARKTP